jgi:hypothetical protein
MHTSFIVTYYDPRKQDLLLHALLPEAIALNRRPGVRATVHKHWKRGPHLRLHVNGEVDADTLRGVQRRLEAYLESSPSRFALDADEHLRTSEVLGVQELVPGPYAPLRADNTVERSDEPLPWLLIDNAEADAEYRQQMVRALEPLRDSLQEIQTQPARRWRLALEMLFLLAHGVAPGVPNGVFMGQLSFRSHLEEFLHQNDPHGQLRTRFTSEYAQRRATVASILEHLEQHLDGALYTGRDALLRGWSALFNDCRAQARALARSGHLPLDPAPKLAAAAGASFSEAVRDRWSIGSAQRSYSAFHQSIANNGVMPVVAEYARWDFPAHRFTVSLAYAIFQLMDFSPLERQFLCWSATHGIEDRHGLTWEDFFPGARELQKQRAA